MKCLKTDCANEIKTGKKYCSVSCANSYSNSIKYKLLREANGTDSKTFCKQCGKDLEFLGTKRFQRTFCSRHCSSIYNNHFLPKKKRKFKICLYCNKEILSYKAKKYCNLQCQGKHTVEKLFVEIENLKNNIRKDSSGNIIGQNAFRRYLISKRGAKCEKCGWSKENPISKKIPIVMNHIDGNPENWNLSNLELLCPNCDSLTPTYKALNKGKGRYSRMQRYKDGKSF